MNPPAVAVPGHGLPVVNGIAPELTVGGKGIRRTSSHYLRPAGLIQLEKLGVCPHVHRIQRHINGHVTDDADAFFIGITAQGFPLPVKLILQEILPGDGFRQFLSFFFQGFGLSQFYILRPVQPGLSPVFVLEGHKQGIIRQPALVFFQESFVFLSRYEPLAGQGQHCQPLLILDAEIHPVGALAPGNAAQFLLFQQPFRHQDIQVNKVRVSRTGTEGLIRGVAVACRCQGQNLPAGLACFFQKIHKVVSLLAHGANAIGAGQGGNVH